MRTRISALFDLCALFDSLLLKSSKIPVRAVLPAKNTQHGKDSRLLWAHLVTPPGDGGSPDALWKLRTAEAFTVTCVSVSPCGCGVTPKWRSPCVSATPDE